MPTWLLVVLVAAGAVVPVVAFHLPGWWVAILLVALGTLAITSRAARLPPP